MAETLIDLPKNTTHVTCERLQQRLADAIVLHTHAKQAHWNVKGPAFIALHELFDRLAALAGEQADRLAERIVALGQRAQGTAQDVVRMTRLPDWPQGVGSGFEHLNALARATAAYANGLRADARAVDEVGEMVSADLLVTLAGETDKMLWMLEAHLAADA